MKKLKDKKLFDTIGYFLSEYLPVVRNKSEHTILSYRDALKLFVLFFEQAKGIEVFNLTTVMITRNSIMEFLDWLERERNCSAGTRNARLSCIRTFYTFMATHGDPALMATMHEIAEIGKKRTLQEQLPVALTEEEVALVLAAPDPRTRIGIRDRLYLTLMYDSGARNNEMLSLKLQHITITGKISTIHIIGKGGKSRVTPISEQATALMRHYLLIFHPAQDKTQYLFYVERNGIKKKMSADNTARIMEKYGRIVRETYPLLPHLHPHLLRRTRAQHLYSAGMPLPLVSEWLGHANMEVTLIYAHADVEMKRKAIEKALGGKHLVVEKELPKYMDDKKTIMKLYGLG